MAQDRIAETVEGVVACANERGFKLQGAESWMNISRYATSAQVPPVGAPIRVGLDKDGFVRETELLTREEAAGVAPAEQAAPQGRPDRETRITRSASINAAIAALSTLGPVDEAELFALAARIESWVGR